MPDGGLYNAPQDVTVSCFTSGAELHYTLNNAEPTLTDPVVVNGGIVHITGTSVLKVKGFKSGILASDTESAAYRIERRGHVFTGEYTSFAVTADGQLWGWGYNNRGQLGIGSMVNQSIPLQVNGVSDVLDVAPGVEHTIIVEEDGSVWGWGNNDYGQVGDGSNIQRNSPVAINGLDQMVSVSAGSLHTLGLRNDGSVWAWGYNGYGQLGNGTTTNRNTPAPVGGLNDMVAVAAGSDQFSVALKADGSVWTWGNNDLGELGNGGSPRLSVSQQINGVFEIVAIAAGDDHVIALKGDGTVWSWGYNAWGQLGVGDQSARYSPVRVPGLSQMVAIGAQGNSSYAIKADGTVWVWGRNNFGQLGDGTTIDRFSPIPFTGVSPIEAFALGNHSLAIRNDGTLWTAGYDLYGQLGDGGNTNQSTPVEVVNPQFLAIVAQPMVFPDGGEYQSPQDVLVTCSTPGAELHYTLNGAEPDLGDPIVANGGFVTVDTTASLKIRGFKDGMLPSHVTSAFYWVENFTDGLNPSLSIVSGNGQLGSTNQFLSSPLVVQMNSFEGVVTNHPIIFTVMLGGASLASTTNAPLVTSLNAVTDDQGQALAYLKISDVIGTSRITVSTVDGGFTNSVVFNETSVVVPSNVSLVSMADLQSYVVDYVSSNVWTWGRNGYTPDLATNTPVLLNGFTSAKSAIAGVGSLGQKGDGTLWQLGSYGYNTNGIPDGYGGILQEYLVVTNTYPVQVTNISNVVTFTAGISDFAVKSDGTLWGWGYNSWGQLGDGSSNGTKTPIQVVGISNVIMVASADVTTALASDGTVWEWGTRPYIPPGESQIQFVRSFLPSKIPSLSNIVSIATATFHSMALASDGTVREWDVLFPPQAIGIGAGLAETDIHQVPGLTNIVSIACGEPNGLALDKAGTLWSWGRNDFGQLGIGTVSNAMFEPVPVKGLTNVVAFACSRTPGLLGAGEFGGSAMAMTSDGIIWVWGLNLYGELGIGEGNIHSEDHTPHPNPIPIMRIGPNAEVFSYTPPTNFRANPVSASEIQLSWTDSSSGSRGYKIERKTGANGTYAEIASMGPNRFSYRDLGLSPATTYFYRIRSIKQYRDSNYSVEVQAITYGLPAGAPSNLSATAVSFSRVDLSWTDNSSNESGFQIERKTGVSGTYIQIGTVPANITSFSDTGALGGTEYYYRVRAWTNPGGPSGYSNEASVSTQDMPLSAPTGLTATIVSSSQIRLTWSDNSMGETGFVVERKEGAGAYHVLATAGANATLFIDTGLDTSTLYTYRVHATNGVGNSGYSNEASGTPFVDSDGDGMPDDWEIAHGLNPNDPSDATQDPDGDGIDNLTEYLLGSDPHKPNVFNPNGITIYNPLE